MYLFAIIMPALPYGLVDHVDEALVFFGGELVPRFRGRQLGTLCSRRPLPLHTQTGRLSSPGYCTGGFVWRPLFCLLNVISVLILPIFPYWHIIARKKRKPLDPTVLPRLPRVSWILQYASMSVV